jgi:hypothetical protein
MTAAVLAGAGKAWELSDLASDASGPSIRLGPTRVRVADVAAWRAERVVERDRRGAFLTAVVFGAGATLFLSGVLELGLRQRFLAGALLLGAIALGALLEAARMTRLDLYRIDIRTAAGRTIAFTTANPDEMQAVMTALYSQAGPATTAWRCAAG